jgi:hypothetical protein
MSVRVLPTRVPPWGIPARGPVLVALPLWILQRIPGMRVSRG